MYVSYRKKRHLHYLYFYLFFRLFAFFLCFIWIMIYKSAFAFGWRPFFEYLFASYVSSILLWFFFLYCIRIKLLLFNFFLTYTLKCHMIWKECEIDKHWRTLKFVKVNNFILLVRKKMVDFMLFYFKLLLVCLCIFGF